MPRDIPVGNGRLLVTFDHQYQIRDIYFPHVGQENHAGAGPCRFGVFTDIPTKNRSELRWTSDPGWVVRQRYLRDTLTSSVALDHREMKVAMYCNDVVDFHRPILVRKIKVKNLVPYDRVVKLMHHQDFNMFGTKIGDTAYYDPELRSIVHYRGKRYIMVTFFSMGEQRIDEIATGTSGFHGAEGTWRDAEDGRLWVGGTNINFGNLPPKVVELFKRSLLVVRTQIDNEGAIIAANDSDIMQFSRDTYSYMWPRDGALVADSLYLAGFPDLARWFYTFCKDVITAEGYFHHKYNPDGSPASSWHPWVLKGAQVLPIQEDETALVLWALWRHYYRYRDIEYVRPLWVDLIQKAADFIVSYRDPRTGLPLPSYDLWEERWGIHAFTVATVYGALKAARNFAVCFGDRAKAEIYNKAAEEVKAGAAKYMFSKKLNRFVRRLVTRDNPVPPDATDYVETTELKTEGKTEDLFEVDDVLDSSMFAIFKFHLFDADDPRVESTMRAVDAQLWVKTH